MKLNLLSVVCTVGDMAVLLVEFTLPFTVLLQTAHTSKQRDSHDLFLLPLPAYICLCTEDRLIMLISITV